MTQAETNAMAGAEDGADAPAAGVAGLASDADFAGACPSITHPQTRQGCESSVPGSHPASLNVDWWESAGCIQWGPGAGKMFDQLDRVRLQAGEVGQPLPCSLGDGQIFVHENGIGSGRASRLEFRLEWCGVVIGLSPRKAPSRMLYNFYLKVSGEPCLVVGFDRVREVVASCLAEWDGVVIDEWVHRLDLCLDVPGLDLSQSIFPACHAGQYLSTMRRNSSHRDCVQTTGFSIGSSPGARLTIYDKLAEVKHTNDSAYGLAMIERRWNGIVPEAAARIEYQLHREFFHQFYGFKSAQEVLGRLSDIVERLVQNEKRPFFEITDSVPDRKGRHQCRANTLPEWAEIVRLIRECVGKPGRSPVRLKGELINPKRATANAIGYLTSAEAELGVLIEGRSGLVTFFSELIDRMEINDEMIRIKAEDKARRAGTWAEMTKFPFGVNQAS